MSSDMQKISWPGWETVGLIGRGSFGAVYEIQRDVLGDTEKAALKVISIPQNSSDIDELYSDGYDDESITSTFQSHLRSIVAEYSLMRKMNGSANIVNCDDIRYVQHDDGIGWDIFIKMELLTPLTKALPADVPEETVFQIAKDICAALELCKKHEIVHRDIKPQNIFVSPNGDYKLGDFGIAKTVEKTMGGTKIGTYKYMAPEVYNNQPYGAAADIYSLGLVLYWLLNERRMPFLPLPPEKLRAGMDESARNHRLSGEPLPPPAHGSNGLKAIVLKACAYDPKQRYTSAAEMLADLRMLQGESVPAASVPVQTAAPVVTAAAAPVAAPAYQTSTATPPAQPAASETTAPPQPTTPQPPAPSGKRRVQMRQDASGNWYMVDVTVADNPAPNAVAIPQSAQFPEEKRSVPQTPPASSISYTPQETQNDVDEPKKSKLPLLIVLCLLLAGGVWGYFNIHLWTEATLDTAATCKICGEISEKLSVSGISVSSAPSKTNYYVGDTLDTSGLKLQATYSNGKTETVTSGFSCSPKTLTSSGKQVINVSYGGRSTSFTIMVQELSISGISVSAGPSKTNYYVGDTLDTSGLNILAVYDNGKTETVTSGFECSPSTLTSSGKQWINVSYGGKSTSFTVMVEDVSVKSLSVSAAPSKTSYYVGDKLDTSGLKLQVTYSNGTKQTISKGFSCSPTTLSSTGKQTIKVSYGGKSTSFNVTVQDVAVSSISVSSQPSKTTYYVGEQLIASGLQLKVTYNNGKTEAVNSGFTCSPTTLSSVGTQKVTISYSGKTASLNVTVKNPSITLSKSSAGDITEIQIVAKTSPEGQAVRWQSSDPGVASISSSGIATARSTGSTTITASFTYGGTTYTASTTLDVSSKQSASGWSGQKTSAVKPTGNDVEILSTEITTYAYYHYCNRYSWGGSTGVDSCAAGVESHLHTMESGHELPSAYINGDMGGRASEVKGGVGHAPACSWNYYAWWRDPGKDVCTYTYRTRTFSTIYYFR